MSDAIYCIYCKATQGEPSAEHVIADALGGCIKLPATDVCRTCNSGFGHDFETKVYRDLLPILVQLRIPGKDGYLPSWKFAEFDDDELRHFVIDVDGIRSAERRKLLAREGNTYKFRTDSAEELELARAEIERKNPGKAVVLSDVTVRSPILPAGRGDDVDFAQPHWNRWAAKTSLNVIAYCLGTDIAHSAALDDVRHFARQGGSAPAGLTAGGVPGGNVDVEALLSEHRITVQSSTAQVDVRVNLFGFCGCRLVVPIAGARLGSHTIVLAAAEKRVKETTSA